MHKGGRTIGEGLAKFHQIEYEGADIVPVNVGAARGRGELGKVLLSER